MIATIVQLVESLRKELGQGDSVGLAQSFQCAKPDIYSFFIGDVLGPVETMVESKLLGRSETCLQAQSFYPPGGLIRQERYLLNITRLSLSFLYCHSPKLNQSLLLRNLLLLNLLLPVR